jgi:thiol-disulfide isomerase/thioredoxin
MNRSSIFHWVLLLIAIGAAIWVLRTRNTPRLDSEGPADLKAAIGQPLPSLAVEPLTMKGDKLTLKDVRGEVVLINFWGTWCPPCVEEFPHLADLAQKMRGRDGFRLLSVSCGGGFNEDFADLKSNTETFLADQDFEAGVYWDPDGATRIALIESAKIDFGYPFTVLIDQSGKIARMWRGYEEGYVLEMEHEILKLL